MASRPITRQQLLPRGTFNFNYALREKWTAVHSRWGSDVAPPEFTPLSLWTPDDETPCNAARWESRHVRVLTPFGTIKSDLRLQGIAKDYRGGGGGNIFWLKI